jgi:glycosyltransferase involved in cell wall biosynthesis
MTRAIERSVVMHLSEPATGAAQYVSELVQVLAAQGGDIILFCPPNFEYREAVEVAGVKLTFAARRSIAPGGFVARVLRNLIFLASTAVRQLRSTRRGQIVHFQFPLYFPLGLGFFLLARAKGCHIVLTAHDPAPHRWLLPRALRAIEKFSLRWAYDLSERLVVHNRTGHEVLVREFGQNPAKITVIPHGPLALTRSAPEFPPFDQLRLLLFGTIRENRGVHLAIQAVQRINAAGNSQVALTIAGELATAREEDYWEACKRLIASAPAGITAIDRYIPDCEVGPLIATCHAMLLPYSNFTSESGVAALALANRRPILATRTGGLAMLLDESDCGISIEAPSVEAIVEGIETAKQKGLAGLREMGTKGATFMQGKRSWDAIGRQTIALYAEVRAAHVPRVGIATRVNCEQRRGSR